MPESACREQSESSSLRFEDLPFSSIPGQSQLFLDYLSSPSGFKKYYPNAVERVGDLKGHVDDVLANHNVDRDALCDILEDQNRAYGSSDLSFENIAKLRETDCVAVLTGQQVGLFTGPLYTIYKALSAIRCAKQLSKTGVKAVPVFWMATEDHDYEEISTAYSIDQNGALSNAKIDLDNSQLGSPVGDISLPRSIDDLISQWTGSFPKSEFTDDFRSLISGSYSTGMSLGTAFGKLIARIFENYGLIIFDPLDERVKKLSAPLVEKAIEKADVIVDAIRQRSAELIENGYHAQVQVEENYFPFFWHDEAGKRVSIKRSGANLYRIAGSKDVVGRDFLLNAARTEPSRFSPGVMLRPVVQDYLFPTICYFGGGAEIAYFAQNSEAYRLLERPITPILHRQSFTVVEPKHARTMEKYGLSFQDNFRGLERLIPEIVERVIDPETSAVFADVEAKIDSELDRIEKQLSKFDPTLADNLSKRRKKIVYHVTALRTKFEKARVQKDEVVNNRLNSLMSALYPSHGLQERTLNFTAFANRYGLQFIDWIYESTDADNKGHRVIYL